MWKTPHHKDFKCRHRKLNFLNSCCWMCDDNKHEKQKKSGSEKQKELVSAAGHTLQATEGNVSMDSFIFLMLTSVVELEKTESIHPHKTFMIWRFQNSEEQLWIKTSQKQSMNKVRGNKYACINTGIMGCTSFFIDCIDTKYTPLFNNKTIRTCVVCCKPLLTE